MSYANIEQKIHSLLTLALDGAVHCTRGFHSPNQLKSVAVRPGAADRQMQGERGRVSKWTVEVAIKVSSGLDLSDFHESCLFIRQQVIDAIDERPTLDLLSGVTGAMLTSIGEPSYETAGRVHTFEQTCYIECKEVSTISTGEYA